VTAAPGAKLVAIADARQTTANDLGDAMREAAGPRTPADAPPLDEPYPSAARQLKPSPGAVVGAIGAVLPSARSCLGERDGVRSATVVFGSDGAVARVELSGSEHPSDECVRAALSRARTMPFLEDNFAARTTVRP
jgi:hypothetical protein